jgi:nucleolar protein 16
MYAFTNSPFPLIRDKKQTLSQNYRRLGLRHKLNSATGGIEIHTIPGEAAVDPAADAVAVRKAKLQPNEARLERDEEGKVVKVTYGKPVLPEFGGFSDDDDDEAMDEEDANPSTSVIQQLEHLSTLGVKKLRTQSDREQDWIARLVEKYGDDTAKMARDKKLNVWQQSEGDIRRRVAKWKSANA